MLKLFIGKFSLLHGAVSLWFTRCLFAFCRHDCVLLRQLVTRGAEKDFVYARTAECNYRAKLASEQETSCRWSSSSNLP